MSPSSGTLGRKHVQRSAGIRTHAEREKVEFVEELLGWWFRGANGRAQFKHKFQRSRECAHAHNRLCVRISLFPQRRLHTRKVYEQQPPELDTSVPDTSTVRSPARGLLSRLAAFAALISSAMRKNAASTDSTFFAEVSKNGIPFLLANSWAVVVSTARFVTRSFLLPTSNRCTVSLANRSISLSHCLTFSNESESVISYTMIIPSAPR